MIMLDEFAFIPHTIAEEFMTSAYPTITSGKTTKVVMVSTPKGMNMFYHYWIESIEGRSRYVPVEVHWSDVPGRDEKRLLHRETLGSVRVASVVAGASSRFGVQQASV